MLFTTLLSCLQIGQGESLVLDVCGMDRETARPERVGNTHCEVHAISSIFLRQASKLREEMLP